MLPATSKRTGSSSLLPTQMCQRFSIDEILLATKNFDDALVIGRGGFGKVYKGPIKSGSSTDVAIRRLHSTSNQGAPEFWAEVEMLSQLRHCNLVSLIGYCNDKQEMVLVYDYMPHGTLEDHLHKADTRLSWLQRLKICIGAARGLDYLHTGTGTQHGVIHRDVKSSNILLDDDFAAKISDFGLAKIGPTNQTRTHVSTGVKGTFGYMDPCYFYTGKLTRKSDVYAFGVVMLEVLCGRPAVDETLDEEQWGLATWAEDRIREGKLGHIIDSRLRGQISNNCLKEFARIAVRCLHNHPKQRPTMAEIITRLEFVLSLQLRMDSSAEETFMAKLRSFFTAKPQLKVNISAPVRAAAIEGEPSTRNSLVNRPVTVGTIREASLNTAPKIIHFDKSSWFSVEDLLRSEAEIIRKGTYWSAYRTIMKGGNQVLVKRKRGTFRNDFESEIAHLGKMSHENILALKACILSKDENLLISGYIKNGSLASFLQSSGGQGSKTAVDWQTKRNIIFGITRGLIYLHTKENVIHGNLTSQNVLPDDNYSPLVADAGHSRLIADAKPDTLHNHAPELLKFINANMKTDVYDLGLIMLELLTGKSAHMKVDRPVFSFKSNMNRVVNSGKGQTDELYLLRWVQSVAREDWTAELFDLELLRDSSIEDKLVRLMELAMVCVSHSPNARPNAPEVLQELEGIVAEP